MNISKSGKEFENGLILDYAFLSNQMYYMKHHFIAQFLVFVQKIMKNMFVYITLGHVIMVWENGTFPRVKCKNILL